MAMKTRSDGTRRGLQFNRFHATVLCSPTRSALTTRNLRSTSIAGQLERTSPVTSSIDEGPIETITVELKTRS